MVQNRSQLQLGIWVTAKLGSFGNFLVFDRFGRLNRSHACFRGGVNFERLYPVGDLRAGRSSVPDVATVRVKDLAGQVRRIFRRQEHEALGHLDGLARPLRRSFAPERGDGEDGERRAEVESTLEDPIESDEIAGSIDGRSECQRQGFGTEPRRPRGLGFGWKPGELSARMSLPSHPRRSRPSTHKSVGV